MVWTAQNTQPYLAHGIAEIEKGFSNSGKTVAVDRTRLSEASIDNLQIAADVSKCLAICHTMF